MINNYEKTMLRMEECNNSVGISYGYQHIRLSIYNFRNEEMAWVYIINTYGMMYNIFCDIVIKIIENIIKSKHNNIFTKRGQIPNIEFRDGLLLDEMMVGGLVL